MRTVQTRIAISSDGHWGNPNRDYQQLHSTMLDRMLEEDPDILLHTGDVADSSLSTLELVREEYLSRTGAEYTVAHGNHDRASDSDWAAVWGVERNHIFEYADIGIIVLNTSDEDGGEIDVDVSFLKSQLDSLSDKRLVLVVSHHWFSQQYDAKRNGAGRSSIMNQTAVDAVHEADNTLGFVHGHNHGMSAAGIHHFRESRTERVYIGSGVFGGTTSTEIDLGYRIIDLYDDGTANTRYMDLTGKQISSSTINVPSTIHDP